MTTDSLYPPTYTHERIRPQSLDRSNCCIHILPFNHYITKVVSEQSTELFFGVLVDVVRILGVRLSAAIWCAANKNAVWHQQFRRSSQKGARVFEMLKIFEARNY